MMQYFLTADPDDDSHGALSKRIHFLKKEEGGHEIMCKLSDEIYEMGRSYGEERGIAIGKSRGEEKMSELILKLISDNRSAEIGKAAANQLYRAALMREYSLA